MKKAIDEDEMPAEIDFSNAERGRYAAREGHRGDQIVEVKIVVPKVQDERSKEILRELAKLNGEDVRSALFSEA